MTPRIAIIGGGSAHWTPRLLLDFVNTPSLAESQVVLMDTAPESLPPVQQLADHISSLGAAGLRTTATTELEAALDGAQFVITGLSVGGFDAMRHDLEIPERYGLPQPVGDSVGPGGISRALRSVPVTRWHRPGHGAPLPRRPAGKRQQPPHRTLPCGDP